MIISILNEKGGVGKTTVATNLARGFQLRHPDSKIVLVDSDPQGSARDWHEANEGEMIEVIGLDRNTLDKDIHRIKDQYDTVIIDGAPQLTTMAVKAILCSDIVLIPVQPSPYDIWASKNLVDLIKQRQEMTNNKQPWAAFVVSRQIVNTSIGREVRRALEDYGLPILKSGTFQRVVYAESAAKGLTVFESDNKEAKMEMTNIVNELWEILFKWLS